MFHNFMICRVGHLIPDPKVSEAAGLIRKLPSWSLSKKMAFGDYPNKIYVGHSFLSIRQVGEEEKNGELSKDVVNALLENVSKVGLDFLVIPICDSDLDVLVKMSQEVKGDLLPISSLTKKWEEMGSIQEDYQLEPSTGYDMVLSSEQWNNQIIFSMSPWIRLDPYSSKNPVIHYCLQAFQAQLTWATHCGAYAVILPIPQLTLSAEHWICPNFCRVLAKHLNEYLQTRVWIRLPLIYSLEDPSEMDEEKTLVMLDGWQIWHHIALSVNKPSLLGIALYLTSVFPKDSKMYDRWLAEPVQALIIPAYLFRSDSSGQTILPKNCKEFILKFLRRGVQLIIEHTDSCLLSSNVSILLKHLKGVPKEKKGSFSQLSLDTIRYRECLKKICEKLSPLTPAEEFEQPCLDQLQCPLQPLRDNLEASTYETFERDPVKYKEYKRAIQCCLADRIAAGHQYHHIMVVGAGRGPLVHAVLLALKDLKISMENASVIALEKNHNAAITLRYRVSRDVHTFWQYVKVVEKDMRYYTPPYKVDILISELLGSFGDNELSPECLDGAQRFLHEDGVSIPCSYFSSLEPVMCGKLWNSAKALNSKASEGLETAYVVKMHRVFYISKEGAKQCFTFQHPNPHIKEDNSHNSRYQQLSFTSELSAVCHGFAGYFHCTLYKSINLSTHPATATKDMISWFPLFFPLHQPFYVQPNQTIKCSSPHRVWYEWCVTAPETSAIHNVNGRSFSIQL